MKFAVIGDPVEHSASPRLHRGFLEEAGIEGSYVALRVARGGGARALAKLRAGGYAGCNVTFPLKEEALEACDALADEARRSGAVNTILFGAEIVGTNTDGIGARSAIEALIDEPVALKRVGVLGYGATARAMRTAQQRRVRIRLGADARRVAAACERFEAGAWPRRNPPEIVVSTLPPDALLPEDLVTDCVR